MINSAGDDQLIFWTTRRCSRWGCPVPAESPTRRAWPSSTKPSSTTREACGTRGVLNDAKTNIPNDLIDMLGRPAKRSLGLELAGDDEQAALRIGSGAMSPGTFGHGGAAGQVGLADPESGVSFAFLTNGNDRNVIRQYQRTAALTTLAAQCVA